MCDPPATDTGAPTTVTAAAALRATQGDPKFELIDRFPLLLLDTVEDSVTFKELLEPMPLALPLIDPIEARPPPPLLLPRLV